MKHLTFICRQLWLGSHLSNWAPYYGFGLWAKVCIPGFGMLVWQRCLSKFHPAFRSGTWAMFKTVCMNADSPLYCAFQEASSLPFRRLLRAPSLRVKLGVQSFQKSLYYVMYSQAQLRPHSVGACLISSTFVNEDSWKLWEMNP